MPNPANLVDLRRHGRISRPASWHRRCTAWRPRAGCRMDEGRRRRPHAADDDAFRDRLAKAVQRVRQERILTRNKWRSSPAGCSTSPRRRQKRAASITSRRGWRRTATATAAGGCFTWPCAEPLRRHRPPLGAAGLTVHTGDAGWSPHASKSRRPDLAVGPAGFIRACLREHFPRRPDIPDRPLSRQGER